MIWLDGTDMKDYITIFSCQIDKVKSAHDISPVGDTRASFAALQLQRGTWKAVDSTSRFHEP